SAAATTDGRSCPFITPVAFRDSWGEPRPGGRSHTGVDMVAPLGVPLVAIESGYIWSPNWHYAGGNGLYLRGDSGDVFYYAHLAGYADGIVGGTRVVVGQVIGYNGDTGNAAVPHLHLGYQPGGGRLTNPYQLMVKLCR
ncbi:MAG TPA: M23 family metallopeptidase, partial [Acidimicrobiia bacterium]|nr:M23 family metallopeptidase [Acidimicrobiia bacterium]